MDIRLCPECDTPLNKVKRKRSDVNTYRYYCEEPECEIIEVKYGHWTQNHDPKIRKVLRETRGLNETN